jgi:hypothetical protein
VPISLVELGGKGNRSTVAVPAIGHLLDAHAAVCPFSIDPSAGGVEARYSTAGLLGVYDDIMHLASTDLLVGTLSSQVSRLAYEVALVNGTIRVPASPWDTVAAADSPLVADSSFHYHSVDSAWYYGGQSPYRLCALTDVTDGAATASSPGGAAVFIRVAAGTELECPVIPECEAASGRMLCTVLSSGGSQAARVALPPAAVGRCTLGAKLPGVRNAWGRPYRTILPAHMQQQHAHGESAADATAVQQLQQ